MKYKLREHMVLLAMILAYFLLGASITLSYFIDWAITGIVLIILAVLACGFLTYAFVYDLLTFLKNKKKQEEEKGDDSGTK